MQREEQLSARIQRLNKEIKAEKAALKKIGAKGSSLLGELNSKAASARRILAYERSFSSGASSASAKKSSGKGGKKQSRASAPGKAKAKSAAKAGGKGGKKAKPMK